jgi:putative membrane protein insertion efficiency factor
MGKAIDRAVECGVKTVALYILRFYKYAISPLLPPACRFTPTCSEYAAEAIAKYGFWKGAQASLRRILRCHPFSAGGYDPVK